MAVAKKQIAEIREILLDFLLRDMHALARLLGRLSETEAYRKNRSFRDTVDALAATLW